MENIDKKKPIIMLVDDNQKNLLALTAILEKRNYETINVESGLKTLELLKTVTPDLFLLDIMMPLMDGFELCRRIKAIEHLANIPVIFLTARSMRDDIINGFKAGAVDYIAKPFDIEELLIRLKNHLELKFARERIEKHSREFEKLNKELEDSNYQKDVFLSIINNELETATNYISSLLPKPIKNNSIDINWKFIPSYKLGGDIFGINVLNDNQYAVYLIDVAGHGVCSALFSVSIINILNNSKVSNTDFTNPAEVITMLNNIFQINDSNALHFTIWYGVYNTLKRELKYTNAGHPKPIIINENDKNSLILDTTDSAIGIKKDNNFRNTTITIEKPVDLYLFSDGAFEVKKKDNQFWSIDLLYKYLIENKKENLDELDQIYNYIRSITQNNTLSDDFTIIKMKIF